MRTDPPEVRHIVEQCMGRIARWKPPPNWSRAEWRAEIAALCAASAWAALQEPGAGASTQAPALVWRRVMADALTFYRREWAFAWRSVGLPCQGHADGGGSLCSRCRLTGARRGRCPLASAPAPTRDLDVAGALGALNPSDQALIRRLFWQQHTEAELAADLDISQPAVSKRKRRALLAMRALLAEPSAAGLA